MSKICSLTTYPRAIVAEIKHNASGTRIEVFYDRISHEYFCDEYEERFTYLDSMLHHIETQFKKSWGF